jgi:hypothetical protein
MRSDVACTFVVAGTVVVVLEVVVATTVDEVLCALVELLEVVVGVTVVVVVVAPHPPDGVGKLAGLAGSLPQSSSRRSKMPSSSRSTPIRVPDPSGTQVYVCS